MVILNLSQDTLDRLKYMTASTENVLHFLGFSLNLQTGDLHDKLQQKVVSPMVKDSTMYTQLTELLIKYASVGKHDKIGKLVNFKDFSGGYAYENAFNRRVVDFFVKTFGVSSSKDLLLAAELLGGRVLEYGDCSVEVEALPMLPLTFILWVADVDDDLPASAKVLFDESAGKFLNVEDLAWLSDLAGWRLSVAKSILKT